jgi:hypothetical protein
MRGGSVATIPKLGFNFTSLILMLLFVELFIYKFFKSPLDECLVSVITVYEVDVTFLKCCLLFTICHLRLRAKM